MQEQRVAAFTETENGSVQDVAGDEWLMLKKETEVTCVDLIIRSMCVVADVTREDEIALGE